MVPRLSGVGAGTNLDVPGGMPDADAASCLAEYASRGPRYTRRTMIAVLDREPATLPGVMGGAPGEAPRFSSTI